MLTGTFGSIISNPTDVVKVRFLNGAGGELSSSSWFPTLRAFPALLADEGIAGGMMRGIVPSVLRGAFIAAGELATYDHVKGQLREAWQRGQKKKENSRGSGDDDDDDDENHSGGSGGGETETESRAESPVLHVVASLVTGVVATTVAAPFDLLKTRAMEARTATSLAALVREVVTTDGPRAMVRGWVPAYFRLGPHALICLPMFEQMRAFVGVGYI